MVHQNTNDRSIKPIKNINMIKQSLSFLLLIVLMFAGKAQTNKSYIQCSADVQYQYLTTYGLNKINSIQTTELDTFLMGSTMSSSEFKGKFEKPRFSVKLYRVKYRTHVPEFGMLPVMTSGLIAIPDNGKDSMPVISYQHGTIFTKTAVPSVPDECMEYKLLLTQYASQGYIVIGADYVGLGESDLPNSYLVKEATEQACVDMIISSKDVLSALKIKSGPLFLYGWSQGGFNTMLLTRKLEEVKIPVKATATASAPVDAAVTVNRWINNVQKADAVWLVGCASNMIFAYERYYQLNGLAQFAIRPQYYQVAKDFADFKIDWFEYKKKTPATITELLNPDFLKTGNLAVTNFWKILEGAQAYRWRCKTPMINYYGESDEAIPVFIAQLAEGFHKVLGSNQTRSVSAGAKADHRATHVYAVINAKPWFDSFLKN